LAIGYVLVIGLYSIAGAPPTGAEAWLNYLPGKTADWWMILGVSVFTDFLYVPVALGLYLALRKVNQYAMIVATVFVGLFVVLDLAITWPNYASILVIFRDYAGTTDAARRAADVAAVTYACAVLAAPLEVVYAIVTLSFGILVTGFVMLKSSFPKATAWLALATGVLGILSLTRLSFAVIGNALCATAWLFFVGYALVRPAGQSSESSVS
jgi:hypothetical protein